MNDHRKRSDILLVVLIAYIMIPIIGQSIYVALPSIGKSLSSNPVVLGWISVSLLLSISVFAFTTGKLADIYGRKKIFLWGVAICTVTSFLLSASYSATALIIFRAIQGFGIAIVLNTGLVLISAIYPAGKRGKPLALCTSALYIGQTIAPFLGGLLTHHLGWRSVFLTNVPFGVFVIAFMLWRVKDEWIEAPGEKIDIIGTILFGIMLVFIMYGLSILSSKQGVWLILAGLLFSVGFFKWEMYVDVPILEMRLFWENRIFLFSTLSAFIFYASVFALTFLLSLYLQYIKGFTAQNAGFVMVFQPVSQAILSLVAAKLVDRVKPHLLSMIGLVAATIGIILFAFIARHTSLWIILAGLFLVASGWAFFLPTNMNDAIGSVSPKYYGTASGMIASIRQLGMMFSVSVTMFIFSSCMGDVQVTPEYFDLFLKSVRISFWALTALCVTGILTLVFQKKDLNVKP